MLKKEIYKGDVYLATLPFSKGSVQTGTRPVLVVQNDTGNKFSTTTIVAPITSHNKNNLPTHVKVNSHDYDFFTYENNIIMTEQLVTLDKINFIKFLGKINKEKLDEVNKSLLISLDLKGE